MTVVKGVVGGGGGGGGWKIQTVQEFFPPRGTRQIFFSCKSAAHDIFFPIYLAAGYFFLPLIITAYSNLSQFHIATEI